MTLKEYLEDYASEDTRQKGLELVLKERNESPTQNQGNSYPESQSNSAGQRDFRF